MTQLTVIKPRQQLQEAAPDWRRRLVCRQCGLAITHPDYQVEVEGRVDYLQVNPTGVTFLFRCYQRAPGAIVIGRPFSQHSWFSGYEWQVVVCQGCAVHLGWLFSATDRFYGLLANQLTLKS